LEKNKRREKGKDVSFLALYQRPFLHANNEGNISEECGSTSKKMCRLARSRRQGLGREGFSTEVCGGDGSFMLMAGVQDKNGMLGTRKKTNMCPEIRKDLTTRQGEVSSEIVQGGDAT